LINNKLSNYFIGLDNRTNALSCNLDLSRPKSAFEKLQANKAAQLIFNSLKDLNEYENLFIWGEPNLCESILFQAKKFHIKTVIAIEHLNRGGLAIPSTKDIIEIIKIFDPEFLSVKIYFEKNRSKLAEELAIERLLNLTDICSSYNKRLIIDVDYNFNLNKNKNHSEKETILFGVEKLINIGINPSLWGIRKTGDDSFDQTLIALINLENDIENKCILEFPHNQKNPNLHSELSIQNHVFNADIFLDSLILWSTKQLSDQETTQKIKFEIEKYKEIILKSNLATII
tara:strand:+ start:5473 stop:6333 length:861 start_codon:yes stop_codon:yes gene_type:complete